MINKNVIKLFILIMMPFTNFSQSIDFSSEVGFSPKNVTRAMENAMGTPYVNADYQQVRIKNFDDKIYSGRYNAVISEMEILIATGRDPIALDISNSDFEVTFLNENKIYRTFNYENDRGITKRGFLVVLSENEETLVLKEEVIKYYDKVPASSSYDNDKPAKFRKEDDNYYIKIKSGKIVSLPTKSKDIAKGFPEKGNEIENFIKKNKLKTKNEDDLIKIANFIGSL